MAIRRYLAMTAAEFHAVQRLPDHVAWMACHFSCYGTGLSNLPQSLPPDSMVILNDRTPVQGHDPELILQQLTALSQQLHPACFLLDFQRPGYQETTDIVRVLTQGLQNPVAVSEQYARDLGCPVFLSPPPLLTELQEYLSPWAGREIWLDAAPDAQTLTVDTDGSRFTPSDIQDLNAPVFTWDELHCKYHIEVKDDCAIFHLLRGKEELQNLLDAAEALGITHAVGLYQQLGSVPQTWPDPK